MYLIFELSLGVIRITLGSGSSLGKNAGNGSNISEKNHSRCEGYHGEPGQEHKKQIKIPSVPCIVAKKISKMKFKMADLPAKSQR